MTEAELFEELVQRLRDAGLLTLDEELQHKDVLSSIRQKLRPRQRQGRRASVPSRKLIAARVDVVRAYLEASNVERSAGRANAIVADMLCERGLHLTGEQVRGIYKQFDAEERQRLAKIFRSRWPDLLPTPDEIEKKLTGKK